MDSAAQRDLARLRAERELVTRQLERIDLQMGRRADEILTNHDYASKSSVGRILGFSHTHVGTLIERARRAPEPERSERIPVMDNTIAGEYVLSIGARVVRSVSAYGDDDVLMQTGLDPRLFVEDGDQRPRVPNMLWQLDNGDWVGVGTASVGYGGSGCTLSVQALTRAGVSYETAEEIVRWRFCDAVNVDDRDTWATSRVWPVHARSTPSVLDDRMIVLFGDGLASDRAYRDESYVGQPAVDASGFYPSETEETHLEAWLRFLNDTANLPEWAQGSRVARVFRTPDVAAAEGFVATPFPVGWAGRAESPCVVIEQGKVQLWGFYYRPRDATQYVPDEAYQTLAMADVYPESLRERDERAARPWSRFVAAFVTPRDGLPDRIDISATGSDSLTYQPTEPVRFMS